jgi:hypothetical protein
MSSFFTSTDKIKVGQNDVSIPSENGLDYRPGGKIDLFIPPTSKFVDLSQSRLKFSVSLSLPTISATSGAIRTQLDAQTGLHSLIRSIRVFTGRKTALLEEIEGYDILTALRFDYESNDNLKAKRALTEGATDYDPATRGSLGTTKTIQGNCVSNQYFDRASGTQSTSFTSTDLQVVKGELHLNTGLFRNEAVFPALLTDGLFVEILLQDARRVFRQLDSVNRHRRLRLNPVFHSQNGSDASSSTTGSFADAGTTNALFFTRDNNQTSVDTCPFVVGEKVTLVSNDNASANGSHGTITQIEQVSGAAVGLTKTKLTVTEMTSDLGQPIGRGLDPPYHIVSTTVEDAGTFDPTYTIRS